MRRVKRAKPTKASVGVVAENEFEKNWPKTSKMLGGLMRFYKLY